MYYLPDPRHLIRRAGSRGTRLLFGIALASATLATIACTPTTQVTVASPQQQTGIAVTGSGTITVKPDIARLSLGVQVTAPTVAVARSKAADAATKVQAALKQKGVADKDITTQSLNISPQYASSPNRTPTITGYLVSNQLQVTVRNIDSTSEVLDAAVAAGGDAVRVNSISFTVDQPEQFLSQAREEAVKNARARAEVLAKAAGITLGAPRSISESTGGEAVFAPKAAQAADSGLGAAPTPINPGEQTLKLTVSVVYDIGGGK